MKVRLYYQYNLWVTMYRYCYIMLRQMNQISYQHKVEEHKTCAVFSLTPKILFGTSHLPSLCALCSSLPRGLLMSLKLLVVVHCHSHIYCHWPPAFTLTSNVLVNKGTVVPEPVGLDHYCVLCRGVEALRESYFFLLSSHFVIFVKRGGAYILSTP